MVERPNKDEYLMSLAMIAATRTTCIRRGVGCVLANERGHVLAIGYNGVAGGLPHCNHVSECGYVTPKNLNNTPKSVLAQTLRDMPHVKPDSVQSYSLKPSGQHPNGTRLKSAWNMHACSGHDLPPGQDNCEAVHAEQNALLQCDDVWDIHTAYVTLSPCKACMKLLLNTSCKCLVFKEQHADLMPLELWTKAGREYCQMTDVTNPLLGLLNVLATGSKPTA